ncbi:MAG: hypothetical protein PF569_02210, partial [Candidatus Woesearchaeota archaeon]|nr:hypothetical protein [Candidatus Woesearchaeota archaeon]
AGTICAAGTFLNGDGSCDTISSYSTGHCTIDANCNSGNWVLEGSQSEGVAYYDCYRGHCQYHEEFK